MDVWPACFVKLASPLSSAFQKSCQYDGRNGIGRHGAVFHDDVKSRVGVVGRFKQHGIEVVECTFLVMKGTIKGRELVVAVGIVHKHSLVIHVGERVLEGAVCASDIPPVAMDIKSVESAIAQVDAVEVK